MAEFLSPGIFIEEVTLTGATVDAVGTSTMAIVGWTKMGPVDTATLVTSPDDFQRKFGGFSNDSITPLSVSAFFANGGSRAYAVRVVPTDAVKAESCITDAIADEIIASYSGAPITDTLANIPLTAGSAVLSWRNNPVGDITGEAIAFVPVLAEDSVAVHTGAAFANLPLTDDDVTVHWSETIQAIETLTVVGAPIVAGNSVTLGTATYTFITPWVDAPNDVFLGISDTEALNNLVAAITGGAGVGSLYGTGTVVDPLASAAVNTPGTIVDVWAVTGGLAGNAIVTTSVGAPLAFGGAVMGGGVDATAKEATIDSAGALGGADAARLNVAGTSIDRDTGVLTLQFAARTIGTNNGPAAGVVTVDYDFGGSLQTLTDNGLGMWTGTTSGGTTVAGSIDYATGEIGATVPLTWAAGTDIPFIGNDVTVSYSHCQWELDATSEGVWGNRMTMRLQGNENFFASGVAGTTDVGEYTKYDVSVLIQDEYTLENIVRETYEEVVFDDVDDAMYFPDLLNDSSDFVDVVDSGSLDVPATFKGVTVTAEVMGTGDAVPTTTFTGILAGYPLVKTSLEVSYFSVLTPLVARVLVADVNGNITGIGLDVTKTNTVDYTTGDFTLNFSGLTDAPDDGKDITGTYVSLPVTSTVDYVFTGGDDGTVSGLSYVDVTSPALSASKGGMYALDRIDEMMQLCIPDFAGDTTVMGNCLDYAEGRRDIFCIFATPSGFEAQEVVDFKRITFSRKSKYAAYYWPWLTVADPLTDGRTILMPPMAHIAGIYARTDNTKNVGKAPGGTVDGALRFLTGLEKDPDKGERDAVYPARINPLINTPQTGLAVWGVRTSSATNDAFKYINAVRLFIFVEKSVFNSTHGLLFESITSNLYSLIKTQLDGFLLNLFNEGYMAGNSPDQGFFVIVDDTNNPPEVVNAGQVIVDVGIAPTTPGEFIRFRFAQKTLTA